MKTQSFYSLLLGSIVAGDLAATCQTYRPVAIIYRGPASCDYCPESVAHVLEKSPRKFHVKYVGPNESEDITEEVLRNASVYVQPGGGDLGPAWNHMSPYAKIIRDYVESGGRYLGFCLGAYLAGHNKGFGLLPPGQPEGGVTDENQQVGAQVRNAKDTVIQVNWQFTTGPKAGTTEDGRWIYFQDGAVMTLEHAKNVTVLGRYTSNQNIAAAITPYGKGWVGTVGPHPEADESWYDLGFKNPDGIKLDIATDFVMAIMEME